MRDEYAKASLALGKASAIGPYVVSGATADALEKLMREVEFDDPNGDWDDEVNRIYDATKECMTKVRADAQLDLLGKK